MHMYLFKCPPVGEWVRKVIQIHDGSLSCHEEQGDISVFWKTDEVGDQYTKEENPGSERQILNVSSQLWILNFE